MEVSRSVGLIILFILILLYFALIISIIIYVWQKKHPHRKLITFLMFLAPIGILISLMILLPRPKWWKQPWEVEPGPKLGDSDVYQCPNCGSPYRLQDYRPDATIVCGVCKEDITRFNKNIEGA